MNDSRLFLLVVCSVIFGQRVAANPVVRVHVKEGLLEGIEKKQLQTEKSVYFFLGIPYAKPPIKDLRFKAPVPIEKWDGVLDASEERDICLQVTNPGSKVVGSEDCLYLNIYTPQAPSDVVSKKAVMIFIYGGGFSDGSSQPYGPDYLIDYDVILVTFNYRLHVFGFLNTGTPSCPGNAGLKDQLLAIKWVKENIAHFGGDSENITLFGQSAGAVSVHLHMLSPLSKGLFNRAIMQSGNALSPWAIERSPESQARKIGRLAGYNGLDSEELVQHLKKQTAEKLNSLADWCYQDTKRKIPGRCISVSFIPSVEKIKDGAFLPDIPENLMKSAIPLPTIIGYNDLEGLALYVALKPGSMKSLLADMSIAVKDNFADMDKSKQNVLLAEIEEFYFKNGGTNPEGVVHLFTDLYFMKFYEAIEYLVQSNVPPYIYLFSYNGSKYENRALVKSRGAAHGDELKYIFRTEGPNSAKYTSEKDKEISNQLCTLWTNFAKTGHHGALQMHIDWWAHTNGKPCYMKIDETLEVINGKLHEERFNFWKKWSKNFRLRTLKDYHVKVDSWRFAPLQKSISRSGEIILTLELTNK